jgi:predicted transcriptional regulator
MFIGTEASFRTPRKHPDPNSLPPEVTRLYRREREIAVIVYERGLATAADVQAGLSSELSNPAIRSMLNRLVAKRILTRLKCGRHGAFVYVPALTQASAREMALRQFAQDFYAGSLASLAGAIADMFAGGRLQSETAGTRRALRLAS